jgi:Ni/Fe-hydrogenase subunit HybB-like protein
MINFARSSPRLFTGIWFAFASYAVMMILTRFTPIWYAYLFFPTVILTILFAGLSGYTFGHRILDQSKPQDPLEAIQQGVIIGIVTMIAFLLIFHVTLYGNTVRNGQVFSARFKDYLTGIMTSFAYQLFRNGWIAILAGGAAGWALHNLVRKRLES